MTSVKALYGSIREVSGSRWCFALAFDGAEVDGQLTAPEDSTLEQLLNLIHTRTGVIFPPPEVWRAFGEKSKTRGWLF